MKNKQLFQKVYREKINKDKNYEEIIKKINRPQPNKKLYWKLAYVCLFLALSCSILIMNKSNHSHELYRDKTQDITTTSKVETSSDGIKETYDGKDIISKDLTVDEILNNIFLPSDFNKEYTTKEIYSNKKNINNYEAIFQNNDGTRSVTISYSNKNKPTNDYHLFDGTTMIVNGVSLIIYNKSDKYITEFTYNKINYLIVTKNITESELNALLKSIIK